MAKQDITIVNTSDTFQLWLDKTNELVELMNEDVLTASIAGDTTLGNATLDGIFTANDLVSNNAIINNISAISVVNNLDPVNFVEFKSPISIVSTQEKLLVLDSSSQKPAINLINAGNANWNISLGTITTASPFVIKTEGSLDPQFTLSQAGDMTLSGSLIADEITVGQVVGNSATATKFATPVNINGVAFDGTQAITITANTTNTLTRGSYLTGTNFNGSAATTWNVDATTTSTASKVVARDTSGNFSANIITAELNGNAATATKFSTSRANYKDVTDTTVAGELMWKNFGNNHTIFDASAGTSPSGSAINNTAAATPWNTTYPILMGWNGVGTYGVRVDSARVSDNTTGNAATANAWTTPRTISLTGGVTGSATISGSGNVSISTTVTNPPPSTIALGTGTTGNYLAGLTAGTGISVGATGEGATPTVAMTGSYTGTFTVTGNITATQNVTAYSDERLKSNIRTIDNALDKVSLMRGVYFDKDNEASTGVIAQEIEKILPEVVLDGEYKSVAYGNIVGILIEAIKELKNEIELLKRNQ